MTTRVFGLGAIDMKPMKKKCKVTKYNYIINSKLNAVNREVNPNIKVKLGAYIKNIFFI